MSMNALILCNGEPPSLQLLVHHLQQADLVICTDGALEWVGEFEYEPHVLIGDMDSVQRSPFCETIHCGSHGEQENSDAEKALLLALERGASHIVLLGATGKRLDHTLGNVSIAARYHRQADIVLADDHGDLRVVSGTLRHAAQPGEVISLIALTPEAEIATEGLRWPVQGPLEIGTRGLSNEACGGEMTVEVRAGMIAVVLPRL